MRLLFLDDSKERAEKIMENLKQFVTVEYWDEVFWTETAADCIELLNNEKWHVLSLDHDLGGDTWVDPQEKNTGSEVVRHILKNFTPDDFELIILHTWNLPRAKDMRIALEKAGFYVITKPFGV